MIGSRSIEISGGGALLSAHGTRGYGNLDRAIEDLLFAAERDPQNPLIAAELGQVYEQRGDLAAAENG
ncbi:MAG: hypothetical protein U0559_02465 [Anaerolineae bacterium]